MAPRIIDVQQSCQLSRPSSGKARGRNGRNSPPIINKGFALKTSANPSNRKSIIPMNDQLAGAGAGAAGAAGASAGGAGALTGATGVGEELV